MALDRLTIITSSGLSTVSDYVIDGLRAVGVVTASTVQVGAATTVHTTGVDLGSGNITSHNINSTGIITATGVTVTGDLTVEGTLAYDDVTNIDSVGVGTFRNGLHIIDSNVAIGHSNPTYMLHLKQYGNNEIVLNNTRGSSLGGFGLYDNHLEVSALSNHPLLLKTNSVERLHISSAGNIGIGENNPTAKLDVKDSQANTVDIRLRNTESNAQMSLYAFGGSSAVGSHFNNRIAMMSWNSTEGIDIITNGTGDNDFRVYTAGYGTNSERFRITSAGNVGINKNNPDAALVVYDTAGSLSSTKELTAEFRRADGTYNPRLQIRHSSEGTDLNHTWSTNAGNFTFSNGDTERLRITGGGNMGLGVIPETWSSNVKGFQIGRQACVSGQTGANIVEISANAYHNSGWKYIESDTATSYYQYQGAHVFSSAASGTADASISFTERLRITSGGNLLLGRTSDYWSSRAVIQENKDGRTQVLIKNDNNHASASSCIAMNAFGNSWVLDVGSSLKNGNALTLGLDASSATPTEKLRIKTDGDVFIGNIAHANDNAVNSSYRTLTLADTTNGAQLHLRGQSPKLFMDVTSGGTAEIYYDSGDFTISSGEPGNAGSTERLRITSGRVSIGGVTSPLGALHIEANQGTDTALWIGDNSSSRYLAINEQSSSSSFNHVITRFNDNAIHAHYILDNPYAQGIGYGSQILFRGNNQATTAYIETSNETSGSARGTLRLRGADNHGLDVRSTGEVSTTHASNIGYETNAATNTRSLVYTSLDAQKVGTTSADWFILKTFYPDKSGRVNIFADMYITAGTYYFSFRVREEGTDTIVFNAGDNGGYTAYENPSGQSGNVHSYKTYKWICPLIKAHKRYYIEMAATNAAGTSVSANASQEVFLKNLYIYSMSGGHSDSTGSMLIQQGHDVSSSASYGGTTRAVMSSTVNRDSLNQLQYFAGTESTFLGWYTTRAYNRYLDFELNMSGSYMWFAQAYGYLYSRGQVAGSMISGYTYTNNQILNKYTLTLGNRGFYGSYRTAGGNLCLKFDSGGNGYSEGKIALFLGTHGPVPSSWRVLRYRQNDTTSNIF